MCWYYVVAVCFCNMGMMRKVNGWKLFITMKMVWMWVSVFVCKYLFSVLFSSSFLFVCICVYWVFCCVGLLSSIFSFSKFYCDIWILSSFVWKVSIGRCVKKCSIMKVVFVWCMNYVVNGSFDWCIRRLSIEFRLFLYM